MPEMTEEALNELERLALAATPGKREWRSDGMRAVSEGCEFNVIWAAVDINATPYVGTTEEDEQFVAATDRDTVLALVKALRAAWEALDGYEALKAHHREHHEKEVSLNARAKTLESALMWIDRNDQTKLRNGGDAEWFKEMAPMKARAALDTMPESAPPRTCPRCGWGVMDGPDDDGNVVCVECEFVFDMDRDWEEEENEDI